MITNSTISKYNRNSKKSGEKVIEKPCEKVIEKPCEKPRKKVIEKPCKKSCEKGCDKSYENCKNTYKDVYEPTGNEYDYIIAGFGTAGSVLARLLSDPDNRGNYRNSVLVLDAGLNRSDDALANSGKLTPVNNGQSLTFDPQYAFTQACFDPDNNGVGKVGLILSEIYSDARMWWGGSYHNGQVAVRGTPERYHEWATLSGNPMFEYSFLIPYMKAIEHFTPNPVTTPIAADRGTNGPLQVWEVQPTPYGNLLAERISDAITSGGTFTPIIDDYNSDITKSQYPIPNKIVPGDLGLTSTQYFNSPVTKLRSALNVLYGINVMTFEGKGVNGRKLNVIGGATVNKVLFKEGTNKAIGVSYVDEDGNNQEVFAKKKVILSAGTMNTAAILMRSGIGPAFVLNDPKVNIPIRVDNPFVGQYIQNHYGAPGAITNFKKYTGIDIQSYTDLNGFLTNTPGGRVAQQSAIITTPTVLDAEITATLNSTAPCIVGLPSARTTPAITFYNNNYRPKSLTTIRIIDRSPTSNPEIRLGHFTDPAGFDLAVCVALFKLMAKIAIDTGEQMLWPPISHFPPPYGTYPNGDDQLQFDAKATLIDSAFQIAYHYTGSALAGTCPDNSVTNGKTLEVWGTKNLMCVDNSIFPVIEDGNTEWSAIIAGIVGALILGAPVPKI